MSHASDVPQWTLADFRRAEVPLNARVIAIDGTAVDVTRLAIV